MPDSGRPRLFRTTAFKLSAVYLAIFTIFAAFLIGYIARNTSGLLRMQMQRAVDAELAELAVAFDRGGIAGLAHVIEKRSRQPDASIYLIVAASGARIAGNVESVAADVLNRTGSSQVIAYSRQDAERPGERYSALVRVVPLGGGHRMLVGRDMRQSDDLVGVVRRSLVLTVGLMAALGLASWLFVSRRVLRRIDEIAETSGRIVAGDLSERLAVTGTGDEFDRLAQSLNVMLTRIERLMLGLKQVSDNIAHDLKTPLTRMRNRVEAVLTRAGSEAEQREVLLATIDEADQLIRTFNALLMIARVEAGSSGAEFAEFDAAQVARDVFELYEPAAEEAGITLALTAAGPVMVRASRELISQALANLVDNAIKYAEEGTDRPRVEISVREESGAITLSVADNGGGIAEGDRARVVGRFVRLEESRSKPGAGLGLSLVAAVAQLHGGRLDLADNKPGLAAFLRVPAPASGHAA